LILQEYRILRESLPVATEGKFDTRELLFHIAKKAEKESIDPVWELGPPLRPAKDTISNK
jgi:hypothetical protein